MRPRTKRWVQRMEIVMLPALVKARDMMDRRSLLSQIIALPIACKTYCAEIVQNVNVAHQSNLATEWT